MAAQLTPSRADAISLLDLTILRGVTLGKIGFMLLGAALQLLVARALGPEQFGLYASIVALVTPLAAVSTVGFQQTVLRFGSHLRARGNRAGIVQLLRLASGSTLVVGTIFMAIAIPFALKADIAPLHSLVVGCLLIPLSAISLLLGSFLRAFELPLAAMLPDPICRSVGLALVLAAGVGGLLSPGAAHLLLANVSSLFAAVVWSSWRTWRAVATIPERTSDDVVDTVLFRATVYAFLLLVANAIATRTITALLASLLPPEDFGAFAVATRLSDLLGVPAWGVALVVSPRFALLVAEETAGKGADLLRRSRRAAALLSAGPVLLTLGFAEPLLAIVGPTYVAAAPVLRIFALKVMVLAMIGPTLAALTMVGGERRAALLMTAFGIAGVAVTYILVKNFGATGGALGQSGVEVALGMASLRSLRQRCSFRGPSVEPRAGARESR